MPATDKQDALNNMRRSVEYAITDQTGKPILYVVRYGAKTRQFKVFTIDRRDGRPSWLMWSLHTLEGYRLNNANGEDTITVGRRIGSAVGFTLARDVETHTGRSMTWERI